MAMQLNSVKNRMLMLSPSVQIGIEKESNINDFKLEKPLGKGAFGKVFKAQHLKTGKVMAIKQIEKKLIQ
jgi:serine/threonine protein kinase